MQNSGIVETTPIVSDGVMYITEPPSTATALDLHTGRPLWTYTPEDSVRRHHHRITAGESRRGHFGQHGVLRNRELPSDRLGRQVRSRPLGCEGGRQSERLLHHLSPARHRRQNHCRNFGRETVFAAFWTHSMPKPANGCGAPGPFLAQATPDMNPGAATVGSTAAAQPG